MDGSEQATLAVSLITLAAAGAMAWRAIHRQKQVPLEERPRQMRRFTRRRIIMSVILAVVGFALLWDAMGLDAWFRLHPARTLEFTTFWMAIIVLLLFLLGLAVADVYAVLFAQITEHYKRENWPLGKK